MKNDAASTINAQRTNDHVGKQGRRYLRVINLPPCKSGRSSFAFTRNHLSKQTHKTIHTDNFTLPMALQQVGQLPPGASPVQLVIDIQRQGPPGHLHGAHKESRRKGFRLPSAAGKTKRNPNTEGAFPPRMTDPCNPPRCTCQCNTEGPGAENAMTPQARQPMTYINHNSVNFSSVKRVHKKLFGTVSKGIRRPSNFPEHDLELLLLLLLVQLHRDVYPAESPLCHIQQLVPRPHA